MWDFGLIGSRDSFHPGRYCRGGTTSRDQSGTGGL